MVTNISMHFKSCCRDCVENGSTNKCKLKTKAETLTSHKT